MYGRRLIAELVSRYRLRPPIDVELICCREGIDLSEARLPEGLLAVYLAPEAAQWTR